MHRRPASISQACCSTLRQEGPWDRFCSTSPRTGGQIADKAHSLTQHHSPSVVGPQGRQGGQKPCPHGAQSLERKDVCTGNDTAQSASHNRYRVSGKHVKGPGKAPERMEPWYWATKKEEESEKRLLSTKTPAWANAEVQASREELNTRPGSFQRWQFPQQWNQTVRIWSGSSNTSGVTEQSWTEILAAHKEPTVCAAFKELLTFGQCPFALSDAWSTLCCTEQTVWRGWSTAFHGKALDLQQT